MANFLERKTKNGEIRYHVAVRRKGFPAERATFTRLTDAKKWARQIESAMEEGRHFKGREAKRHTLGEAIDRYAEKVLPTKPKSVKQQTPQLEWWKGRIGGHALANVTPAMIVKERDALLEDKAAPTANRYMAVLSHVFTVCVQEWGWVEDSPMRKIKRLPENRGRVRFLDEDVKVDGKGERTRLLDACRESTNPHLYDVVVVALSTGCRKQEILNLRWPDVDLPRGVIVLHDTKNGERRAVPLTGHALDRMRERSRIRRIDCDCVFPQEHQSKPVDIDRDFARARDKAKVPDFRFHDLRHSAASYLAMNGATLAEIAAVLGHKTLAMVQRYAHLSDAHTSAVVDRMNANIFGEVNGKGIG